MAAISKSNIVGRQATMEFNENLINENYSESMTDICKRCNDKYFAFECNKNEEFFNCCHHGKVILPENPS